MRVSVFWLTVFAAVGAIPFARAALRDGALRVEVITAYNLVVDSNAGTPASYAPRSAYIGATFHNDGTVPLTDLIARIGDYKGGAGDTPGIYPARTHTGLTGPLPGGAFAFTHEGGRAGLADATRYIAEIPAGGSVTVYWLISYPQTDIYNVPCWGKSVKPDDDLWLEYDIWATAKEGGSTPRRVDVTRTFTFRNEISASANKIFPNGANKVPDYYKELLNQYYPAWTNAYYDGTVGTIISTDGIWYDLGNVGEGFDNNGDFVPDHNAWMQPVGDPSLFDPSAFRLVRTYAFVIVKLKTGGETILSGQDQLYFENIPENNGAVGYVRYEYMPLRSGASSVTTPYQEVASGRDNEKFNADYGVSLGETIIAGEANVSLDKTVDKAVAYPNDTLNYSVSFSNTGTVEVGNSQLGIPLVVQDAIPPGTTYVGGTAAAGNTLPSGVSGYHVFYSTDGGNTWTNAQPSPASAVTHLQWWLSDPLLAGQGGSITFAVTVNNPYTRSTPIISNTAGLSFGNTPPFLDDTVETRVLGYNSVGDTVFADTGVGTGGYLGNGIQDGTEPGIANITVWLYADINTNGVIDTGEPLVATTNTAANGAYLFNQLADGRYVVAVDTADPDLPAGYTVTTPARVAVDLDSARTNSNPVSVLTADFGFAPALVLTKRRNGNGSLYEGQLVTYTITVTNNLPGDGTGVARNRYTVFPTNGVSGTQGNSSFLNPTNLWRSGEPDQTYATVPYKDVSENVMLNGYVIRQQVGAITNVAIRIPMRVNNGPFPAGNTLQVIVRTNGVQIGNQTFDCSVFGTGTNVFQYDITGYLPAWSWNTFIRGGSALEVELIAKKTANPSATLDIDSVGFRLLTSQLSAGAGGTTTLDPVPLDDFYDPAKLSYVSSSPSATSATVSNGVGVLRWSNLGPIYPGGGRIVTVTFKVRQPAGNVNGTVTNTASVTQAYFIGGRPANQDQKQAVDTVLPTGTIGDFIWRDLDRDGIQDAGEPGIFGVTVQLRTNGVLIESTVTDATGKYLFEGLAVSNLYTVTVVSSTLPGGSGTPTYDLDGTNTAHTANVLLLVNSTTGTDTRLDVDFGYTLQSLIRGTIWHDRDRDAYPAPESGEERLGGVTVQLYNGNNVLVATTNTAADGTYLFVGTGVTNGTYYVRVNPNSGPLNATWTRSYDSDGLGGTAHEVVLTLVLGGLGIADFSYYLTGSSAIGDTLFYDWNGNGVQDTNDTGIANVTVRLYRDANTNGVVDAASDALVATTVTATNGWYLFSGLPADAYIVAVDQADSDFPPLYSNTYDPYGAKDGVSALTVGVATNLLQDFGYQPYGFNSIGDTVWRDFNADGVQSGASETGISNVTVRLLMDFDGDGTYTLIRTAVTDAAGKYLFASLPDGRYRVEVVTTSPGLPNDSFGHPYRPTTAAFYATSVSGGVADLDNDFGFAPLGAIGDTIFWDGNRNGDQDWNEPGISGVRVDLYLDVNNNGVYDGGDIPYGTNVWTDANGKYLFAGLPPGEYVVRVDPASGPLVGAVLSADPEMDGEPCPVPPDGSVYCDGQTDVTILPGTSFMGADFGYRSPLGVLGDLLWIDLNTNGVRDAGEQGIPYVTVALYKGADLVATNVTDADGYYLFANLSNGTYRVTVLTNDTDFPLGLAASYDVDGTLDNTTGEIVISGGAVTTINGQSATGRDLDIDFGYRYAGNNSLSGTVGLDDPSYDGLMNGLNPSGPGPNEYAFANVTIYLHLWNDDGDGIIEPGEYTQIASTLTDTNGDYSFAGLPSGDGNDRYIVALSAPASDLYLTSGNRGDISVYNTTNAAGVSLSAYQVMPVTASRDNVDFAFRSAALRDFGDLPVSYSTTIADQPVGPSHTQTGSGPYLGSAATTAEPNGQPSPTASSDGGEDGVVTLYRWLDGADGGTVRVQVSGASGWLVGWIDFNQDGTFTNANERVIDQAVSVGQHDLVFDIPAGTFGTDGPTVLNARFRIYPSSPFVPMFTGEATGGEVEDHQFVFGLIGNRVWEDANGNGVQDAGEPGVSNAVVRLYDAGGIEITNTVTAADGSYAFTGLPVTNYSLTFAQPSNTFFTTRSAGGDAQLDSDAAPNTGASGAVSLLDSADRRDIDAGLYVPAQLFGYVFVDKDSDLIRDTGDSSVTNALVWLVVNGATVASTSTDEYGYYFFGNVPAGTVSVLVSRAAATLIDVPTEDPAASDVRRNRALAAPADTAYIAYSVTSGYGVLSSKPGEPLNFGFASYPLSTALDISVYASGGGVLIELWTVNESGQDDIVIYAWLGNAWTEVARVPGEQVKGEGSNRYEAWAYGLEPGQAYRFKIVDEAGFAHYSDGPLEVRSIRVDAVRMNLQTMAFAFDTEPGRRYAIEVSTDLVEWTPAYVSRKTPWGWTPYSVQPFTASSVRTEVLVPAKDHQSAFFRVVKQPE